MPVRPSTYCCFNTQPPEGGWPVYRGGKLGQLWFQHTAARRRLVRRDVFLLVFDSFNTQPPEGGWTPARRRIWPPWRFQHTAARRRLDGQRATLGAHAAVSTHSRPKAAGASLKSLAPSGFAAPISLGSQEKREREYNTAFSVTSAFTIS